MEGRGRDYTNEIAELSQDLEEEQVLMLSWENPNFRLVPNWSNHMIMLLNLLMIKVQNYELVIGHARLMRHSK
jgi:hypothetical protein